MLVPGVDPIGLAPLRIAALLGVLKLHQSEFGITSHIENTCQNRQHWAIKMAIIEGAPPTQLFTLSNGYVLCYAIYGDRESSKTIFVDHGFPGSQIEALVYDGHAKRHNVRMIAVDRPGMGGSTYQPNRRLADWPANLLELADHLGAQRFAVVGASGGAPYTFACLYHLPKTRCIGGGVIAGMYPMSVGTSGMMIQNRLLFTVARWSLWPISLAIEYSFGRLARDVEHPERLEQLVDNTFRTRGGPDKEAMDRDENNLKTVVIEDMRQSLKQGDQGATWDLHIIASDWGFKLEDIIVDPGRLVLWHGGQDMNIPVSMAKKGHELLRGSELRIAESEAHLSMSANRGEEVIETISKMLST